MRGIAAMTVLIGHCLVTFRNGRIEESAFHLHADNLLLTVMQLTVHANSAVMFFYVLSGLVLGESLRRGSAAPAAEWLPAFVVRRLFRLYPAAIPSVLLAALVLTINADVVVPGMTSTVSNAMKTSFDGWVLIKNLLCAEYAINPLLWSVQVEVVMIAILPALFIISNRLSLFGDLVVLSVLLAIDLIYWIRCQIRFDLSLLLSRPYASALNGECRNAAGVRKSIVSSFWVGLNGAN